MQTLSGNIQDKTTSAIAYIVPFAYVRHTQSYCDDLQETHELFINFYSPTIYRSRKEEKNTEKIASTHENMKNDENSIKRMYYQYAVAFTSNTFIQNKVLFLFKQYGI